MSDEQIKEEGTDEVDASKDSGEEKTADADKEGDGEGQQKADEEAAGS
jgi:hypothetical protein